MELPENEKNFRKVLIMMQKALGLYIHIPFCQRKCNYCDFPSYSGMEEHWKAYSEAVVAELILKADEFRDSTINTIFIGGGTPSLIPYEHIVRILNTVHSNYKVLKECESTIESNPGTLSSEKLIAYRDSGINRLSMGLQACQNRLLNKLGRIHTLDDFETALGLAKKSGFANINADIIFGIPDQTFEDWQETVAHVLEFGLTHISCYSLMIEDETVFGRMKNEGHLQEMDDELDRRMYHYAVDRFSQAGFDQYEISNFAKPQYQCQHNMNCWEREEYIGIGSGAHSFYQNRRYANTANVLQYINGVREKNLVLSEDSQLSSEEGLSEKIFLGLRLNQGIDMAQVSEEFGIDVENKYQKNINFLLSRRLVERDGSVLRLTRIGMDMANTVFVEFI